MAASEPPPLTEWVEHWLTNILQAEHNWEVGDTRSPFKAYRVGGGGRAPVRTPPYSWEDCSVVCSCLLWAVVRGRLIM